ncbi:Uncharacterised protein [Mycobacteroides abscessus subsp. abscessus]|nr:Uncharacterised protein [Mycobacteroides abscessus subsp. abscessus]
MGSRPTGPRYTIAQILAVGSENSAAPTARATSAHTTNAAIARRPGHEKLSHHRPATTADAAVMPWTTRGQVPCGPSG